MPKSSASTGVFARVSRFRSRRPGKRWDVPVAVAAGGALGSVLRFWLSLALPHSPGGFPWPTFAVNAVGCLVIGVFMVVISEIVVAHRLLRPFVGVGVLGGFTTFSTYVTESAGLLLAERPRLALVYLLATVVVALSAVLAGVVGARSAAGLVLRGRHAKRAGEGDR